MIYWGLSYGHHDAACVILENNNIVFAKRLGEKDIHQRTIEHMIHYGFPDKIYFFQNQTRDLWRKLKTKDWKSLLVKHPKLPIRKTFGNHHLSHAAAGFYTSTFNNAVIIVIDAIGEQESLAIYHATNNKLNHTPLLKLKYPHSVGLFYSHYTAMCGFQPNKEENEMMKLAYPISQHDLDCMVYGYRIINNVFECTKNFHTYPTFTITDHERKASIASTIQYILESYIETLAKSFMYLSKNVVFTGGVAYNTKSHNILKKYFNNLYVPSHPGDAGSAYGAILQHTHYHVNLTNNKMFNYEKSLLSN